MDDKLIITEMLKKELEELDTYDKYHLIISFTICYISA